MNSIKLVIISDMELYIYEDWLNVGYMYTALKRNYPNIDIEVKVVDFNDVLTIAKDMANDDPMMVCVSVLQENYNHSIRFIK